MMYMFPEGILKDISGEVGDPPSTEEQCLR